MSKERHLDIWEDVLKKSVRSDMLLRAPTVPQKDSPYNIQVFELLVAESLNLQDKHTKWEVTQEKHDGGIDLLGEDETPCETPFTTAQYRLLSVGQVKRSKRSYKYEDFREDIRKARGYWTDSDLFNGNAPKQFVFILSTEGKNGVQVLQKHLKEDLANNTSAQFKVDQLTHIQLIDASHIIKSWKLNLNYFKHILEYALTPEQMECFCDYISGLDCSWITMSVTAPETGSVGEVVVQTLTIETPSDDISFDLRARWVPPKTESIQLLHPLGMEDPQTHGYSVPIRGKSEIQIFLRSLQTGMCDFGKVELYSEENAVIAVAPLKTVNIHSGLSPVYYSKPARPILMELRALTEDNTPTIIPVAVSGCGGIGKSSLLSEVMVYAVQRGYCPIDIQQTQGLLHPKILLHRLFLQLLRPYTPRNMFLSDLTAQLKLYLGSNFRKSWEAELKRFFRPDDCFADTVVITECLVTLILSTARDKKLFIWLSNMHWASKEALDILHNVIEALDANQSMIRSRVFVVLEGRSGETFTYDGQPYYAVFWEKLLRENLLRTYPLNAWSHEESKCFLQQLFVEPGASRAVYDDYFERLLSCSSGVPMHMLELVRMQVEQGVLAPDPKEGYRLRINRVPLTQLFWANVILDAIERRIAFYRNECSDFVDVCAIFAALDDSTPPLLTERLMKHLHTEVPGIGSVLVQSGFLTWRNHAYHFCHEHYQAAFRMQQVKNKALLSECFSYYNRLTRKKPRDLYSEIKLWLLDENVDFGQVRQAILALLRKSLSVSMQQSLYKLLIDIPPAPSGPDIPLYKTLFLLAETYVRDGSWKSAQEYLERLLTLPRGSCFSELLIHVKAHQELSNILGDRLLFDRAIRTANDGLDLIEILLKKPLTEKQRNSLYVEREKLLARLAVCYWFSGDFARGLSVQRRCYDMAVAHGDKYSAGHVLYEIGTLALHFDPKAGVAIMEVVLAECRSIPSLEKHERTLIETQLLIGKLLLAAGERDGGALREVCLECVRLLNLKAVSPHSYEEFLCLTMRGICAFLKDGDASRAQGYFLESLRCAIENDMPNLTWKALFHAAQMCSLLNDRNAELYAKEAYAYLDDALKNNPKHQSRLMNMLEPVLERLDDILGQKSRNEGAQAGDTQTMISLSKNGCLFVIMN